MSIDISLGWNCWPTLHAIEQGWNVVTLRTTPFAELSISYPGVVECIKDKCCYLYDPAYFELVRMPEDCEDFPNDLLIRHTKYKCLFIHESPEHRKQGDDINSDFINNNYLKLIKRYKEKVDKLMEYLYGDQHINFILARADSESKDLNELHQALLDINPTLKYSIDCVHQGNEYTHMYNVLLRQGYSKDHPEVLRALNQTRTSKLLPKRLV